MTYEEIEIIFDEELAKEKKIKTKDRRFEDIAIETIANEKLKKILKDVKTRIRNKMNPEMITPKKFI